MAMEFNIIYSSVIMLSCLCPKTPEKQNHIKYYSVQLFKSKEECCPICILMPTKLQADNVIECFRKACIFIYFFLNLYWSQMVTDVCDIKTKLISILAQSFTKEWTLRRFPKQGSWGNCRVFVSWWKAN